MFADSGKGINGMGKMKDGFKGGYIQYLQQSYTHTNGQESQAFSGKAGS